MMNIANKKDGLEVATCKERDKNQHNLQVVTGCPV